MRPHSPADGEKRWMADAHDRALIVWVVLTECADAVPSSVMAPRFGARAAHRTQLGDPHSHVFTMATPVIVPRASGRAPTARPRRHVELGPSAGREQHGDDPIVFWASLVP